MSKYYSVEVEDHITHAVCVVGQMLTLSEANQIRRCLDAYGACKVTVKEFTFLHRKGRIVR